MSLSIQTSPPLRLTTVPRPAEERPVAAAFIPFTARLSARIDCAQRARYQRAVNSVLTRFILRYRAFQAYGQHL